MNKSDELDLKSTIFYYFREKQYNSMLNKSKEGISKFKGDASFHLFHCLSLILANRLEEGIHSLETINMENEIKLAVTIALMYSHKLFGVSNKNLFLKLDGQMRDYRKDADAGDFYYSAFVLLCFNKSEKALDYAEKALAMQSSLSECLSLKGWILLYLYERGKRAAMNIKDVFEHALQLNPKNLDIIMGFTESCLLQNDSSKALEIINKAIVHHSATNLPLLQKLKIQLAAFEWDQVQETVNRINTIDSKNLYVKKISIIIKLCRLTNYEEAALDIENLSHLLDTVEPGNIQIVCEYSQLFSGICNKNVEILSQTTAMLVNALQNNPESLELIIELGYQALARGNSKEAARYFKSATKIDETSLKALLGLSMCEYNENGNSEQIRNQVQFLLEVKDAQENLLLKYIQAKISDTSETSLSYLKHICDVKLFQVKSYPYSDSYLLLLEVDFMLDVIRECFQHISVPQSVTDNIYEILNVITRACPGFSECLLLLAKLQYIKGDNTSAMNTLDKLLVETKNIPSEAQLLMAEIQVQHGLFDRAAQSLEVCVSHNFKVRENPIYHYVIALVDKNTNNYADAIKSLTTALSLMNTTCRVKYLCNISLLERSSIYIELVDVLSILGQSDEASKILEEAIEELKGTPEESRILLLSAEHLLMRKNVQGAIDILTRIKVTDSCYVKAKSKHAEVLLKYRKDKYAYLDCYHDFVDENPGPDSYILLADAYINVLEPDDALEYYDKALKTNPNDPTLISKMGKALVDTHYFFKAVNYYKEAIKKNNNPELKLQLAELYINLKDFEKGEIILLNELEVEKSIDSEDVTYVRYKVRLLNLLAQIQEKSGNVSYAIKNLKDAMDNQNRLCKRLNVDQSNENSSLECEIEMQVKMFMKLGEMAISLKNHEQAINYYKEGLEVSPNNITTMVALAKLYLQMHYLELCQQICSNILKLDPENETASVIMADIAFRKVDFDMALFHFTQLVAKQPTNWEALIRLVEILRRTGNISNFPEYLTAAEKNCDNPSKETGLIYCTALYQKYTGNLNGSLRNFNAVRQDPHLGQMAIYNMIEICLNPDDEMLGDQFLDSDDIEYRDSRSMALKTADRLLKELKGKLEMHGDEILTYRLLSNLRLLATKDKYNIDRALDDFISMTSENAYKDNIGVALGIASAYTLLKQGQRAKNQLKRIVKFTWTFEDAEYLERCWLLLADYYIQSSKYDIAADLVNKVIQHNKACIKAYEYLGFIAEKEQHYKDAANYYEQAWKFGGKSNPTIGFKLAYCLMKCKKYPDAIDMAQEVLKLNSDYPRIKKDVLDKCMNNLRI